MGVSDAPQGPGWWQASDGRWYPPQATPGWYGSEHDVLPEGAPAYVPLSGPAPTSGKATATLVLAIASFVVCPILPAIAALVVGAQAAREIRESGGRVGGDGLVKAGRILAAVHLGLSVLVVPIMAAIAIPTFLGAQERAQDRAAQSDLRNAYTAERVYYTDHERWTDDPTELVMIEPSLRYETGLVPNRPDVVFVAVEGQIVGVSARSESGTCFYLSGMAPGHAVAYAEDEDCGAADEQQYVNEWE